MRWLAASILCLLTTTASAENIIRLPTALYCGPNDPANDQEIKEQYGELIFLEGDGEVMSPDPTLSYHGKVRIFLDPQDGSYSIFLESEDGELMCLVTSGEKIQPVISGDET